MRKFYALILPVIISGTLLAQGPYAPAAGQDGSTAVYKDSELFKSWATGIEVERGFIKISDPDAIYNGSHYSSFGVPGLALGKSQESTFDAVSLGDGGSAILTFDRPIVNKNGPDFAVFENSFSDTYLELAFVEVSSDGKRFVRFPAVSLTQTTSQIGSFASIDPTNIHNFAGKYKLGYGTPFDLEELKDSAGIDLNNIRFVRLKDVVGCIQDAYASYDSEGNKINDPWPTSFHSGGFDLEAIGVINSGSSYAISTFDELPLGKDLYWNGSDKSGGFTSGAAFFKNTYTESDFGDYWSGFAYSNMRNDSVAGYSNQYSAITKGGINAPDTGGTNYVVAYYSSFDPNFISFNENKAYVLNGLYITNSTYTYLSMKNGDDFSKKFGGSLGNDPDFLKVNFWGEKTDSTFTDTLSFYLADFRFDDNSKDYLVNSWKWVDLQQLGEIRKLHFNMSSSDNGAFGMNTPSYFCMDNLSVNAEGFTTNVKTVQKESKIYPNPFTSSINVANEMNNMFSIYDLSGHIIMQKRLTSDNENIGLDQLSKGVYIVRIQTDAENKLVKIIKK